MASTVPFFMFFLIFLQTILHIVKDRGYLRDENDIGLDFRTGLLMSFEEYSSIYQMAVQKLSERLVFRGYCAEGILYP